MLEKRVLRLWSSQLGFAVRGERCWQSWSEMEMVRLCRLKNLPLMEKTWKRALVAKWPREQLDSLLENLPLDQALCIHDYSEDYACRFQDEIQSQYFNVNKVSLHVTILYRYSNAEVDGVQSTEEEPPICKEHLFLTSDEVTQDHDSVLHIQN